MLSEIFIQHCDPVIEELQKQFSKDLKGKSLYYVGSKPLRNKFHLGIVGSRRPSLESHQIIENLFSLISDLPVRIISGGALGVDAQSHACALRNNIPTYAWVVGDPTCATPFTNRNLFSRISITFVLIESKVF
jgi:DNA processing protein